MRVSVVDDCLSELDKGAHRLMAFWAVINTDENSNGEAFYHQDRLYSVVDKRNGIVSLVFAANPREAKEKVKGNQT